MTASMCVSCGAAIVWARTGSGKPIPIDAEPTVAGNVELATAPNGDLTATVWGSSHIWPADRPRYRTHFVTCPEAAAHRRRTAAR